MLCKLCGQTNDARTRGAPWSACLSRRSPTCMTTHPISFKSSILPSVDLIFHIVQMKMMNWLLGSKYIKIVSTDIFNHLQRLKQPS